MKLTAPQLSETPAPNPTFAQQQNKRLSRLVRTAFCIVVGMILLNLLYSYSTRLCYLRPGITLYHQGNYRTAERDLRMYLRFENDPTGHFYLGQTLLAEGKKNAARAQFEQDRALVPVGGKNYEWRLDERSSAILRQRL